MSGTIIHVGKKRVQTVTSSDGSDVDPASITVQIAQQICGAVVDPATGNITLTGVAVGIAPETISAPGFTSDSNVVTVIAAPGLVVTDGPEF